MSQFVSLSTLITIAGWAQLTLCIAILPLPKILGWRQDIAQLRPITREIFWVYAAYIWTMICSFGLVSALATSWILDDAPLAAAVTVVIALFWSVRLVIQFAAFDRRDIPTGAFYRVAEISLVSLFTFLAATYSWAAIENISRLNS